MRKMMYALATLILLIAALGCASADNAFAGAWLEEDSGTIILFGINEDTESFGLIAYSEEEFAYSVRDFVIYPDPVDENIIYFIYTDDANSEDDMFVKCVLEGEVLSMYMSSGDSATTITLRRMK